MLKLREGHRTKVPIVIMNEMKHLESIFLFVKWPFYQGLEGFSSQPVVVPEADLACSD